MGDRCYMAITVRKCDVEKFEEAGFCVEYQDDNEDDTTQISDGERNYGNTDDLPRDVPFYGYHGEGGDYGGRVFACDGAGGFAEACCGHSNTYPTVEIKRDRSANDHDMKAAHEYWEMYEKAYAALHPSEVEA